MARKQYGLKFEEVDVDRWDAWAKAHGMSRTMLIEMAVERVLSDAKPKGTLGASRRHEASPGVRRAYICRHSDSKGIYDCKRRTFAGEGVVPDCPEHGQMTLQVNRPYMGQSTLVAGDGTGEA